MLANRALRVLYQLSDADRTVERLIRESLADTEGIVLTPVHHPVDRAYLAAGGANQLGPPETQLTCGLVGGGCWLVSLAVLRHPTWRELARAVEMVRPRLFGGARI